MNLQKVSLNKMTKEEKLEFRKQKKELKDKISEEDKKRIELISKPAIQYRLIKIKSNICKLFILTSISSQSAIAEFQQPV